MNSGIYSDNEKLGHWNSVLLAHALPAIIPVDEMVYDLGCGNGFYISKLLFKKYIAIGYEGNIPVDRYTEFILQSDITEPLLFAQKGTVLCLEVGEHIPVHKLQGLIDNIVRSANKLIISWAVIGQGGKGHVNEQPNTYIIDKLQPYGFKLNKKETDYLRDAVEHCNCWWFKNTLMVFDI